MIYELRLYSVAPGRMADLHARLRDHVPPLFERHGLSCIGRWTGASGPRSPLFVYLIAHASFATREASWASLYSDPQWLAIRGNTNAGSEMIERYDLLFLKLAAGWTPCVPLTGKTIGGLHELVFQETALGEAAAVQQFLAKSWLPLWRLAGAEVMGAFDVVAGCGLPRTAIFLAWTSAQVRHSGWQVVQAEDRASGFFAQQRKTLGRPLFAGAEVHLLEPAPYALPDHPWAFAG